MLQNPRFRRTSLIAGSVLLSLLAAGLPMAQQPSPRFGGAYTGLEERRQRLVNDWVGRFVKATDQSLDPGPFYDEVLSLSAKTTFDAVTHALMTTALTDTSGAPLGDALDLVERVDSVRGEVTGTPGDRQFRMYVRLTPNARTTMDRSREFRRATDNTVYHRGYPLNYREQGPVPSIQVSIAQDNRQADIDVDYRAMGFPLGLFSGHLTAANSDVRAGNNADRHNARWMGFQSWWRGFLGVRLERNPDAPEKDAPLVLPKVPRAGKQAIDVMAHDFLQAWLVEGDAAAAMGYVSERAYSCLAEDAPDPEAFDRGIAPFQLMINLKAAHDALGAHNRLDGLIVGVRLATPALKVVTQPHHAEFVLYSVPDDVAAAFSCESRLMRSTEKPPSRSYGHYFGSTFYISGHRDTRVALLWAKDNGYWKIVSWKTGIDDGEASAPVAAPAAKVARIKADSDFVEAARAFLETWLVRKDYDAAFRYLSRTSYACYDVTRDPDQPAAASLDDAGVKIRQAMERAGDRVGTARNLDAIVSAVDPVHPAVRLVDHAYARAFSLSSLPTALADASACDARVRGVVLPDPLPLQYGAVFGTAVRFRTPGDDAAVLRLLWRKEQGAWRIATYTIETP